MSYSSIAGKKAAWRLQQRILPALVWNQESYGRALVDALRCRAGARWLDAGCGHRILGNGLETLEDAAVGLASVVVGIDADLCGIRAHRNIGCRLCSSLSALPFPDESFDIITCNMVVEHLADPEACLAEMNRVLAPGGAIIIHTPNLRNYMVFLNHTMGRILPRRLVLRLIRASEGRSNGEVFRTFYRMNTVQQMRRLARAIGLYVEQEEALPAPRPFLNFFLPGALVQLLITRVLSWRLFQGLQATLLVVLRKPVAHSVIIAEYPAPVAVHVGAVAVPGLASGAAAGR